MDDADGNTLRLISQLLLPAFAAAWNLVGGEKLFASHPASDRLHTSPDGFFAIERPDDWEFVPA